MAVPLISFWSFVFRFPYIESSICLKWVSKKEIYGHLKSQNKSFWNAWVFYHVVVLYYLFLVWFTYLDMGFDLIILTVFGRYQFPMFCFFNMIVLGLECSPTFLCDSNFFIRYIVTFLAKICDSNFGLHCCSLFWNWFLYLFSFWLCSFLEWDHVWKWVFMIWGNV